MTMKRRLKVSKGGQISIPAPIRRRWGTSMVSMEDRGDRIIVEPTSDDPVAAAEGALAEFGPIEVGKLRRRAREDERAAQVRRSSR